MLATATGREPGTSFLPSPAKKALDSPILFLDIDGVLLAGRHWRSGTVPNNRHIPRDTVAMLNEVCWKTGCSVVVISTWRVDDHCRRHLRKGGFHGRFHKDWRTKLPREIPGSAFAIAGTRGQEVEEWLRRHSEVGRYAIIDDDSDFSPAQMPRLVRTAYEEGMTWPCAHKLTFLLSG